MTETWMPAPGYDGRYEVSDEGRVRSAANRPVKQWSSHGYLMVRLWNGHEYKNTRVHRLVLLAFIGPCPEGMEGCHNNGDRSDARLANLRWDTHASNLADRHLHGSFKSHCVNGHPLSPDNVYVYEATRKTRHCRTCSADRAKRYAERKRLENPPAPTVPKTHCIHGHSLEDAYVTKRGRRNCRTCAISRAAESYRRKVQQDA